jgi:hypothetical protein
MRRSPTLSYLPARLSLVPTMFAVATPPDVVCVTVAPAVDGMLSLGTEVNVLPAAIEACRARGGLVVAQVNSKMPWTYGDAVLDPTAVDVCLEVEAALDEPSTAEPDDAARRIGELVAARVGDGATLQLGIGMVPDATLPGLGQRRGLAVWSEMFSDGVLDLDRSGALDPDAVLTASFVYGSAALYAWLHRNPRSAADAHRDDERASPDRGQPVDDLHQHRVAGRLVRAGQRLAHRRADPLRLRRPDRLHRGCPALCGWPGDDGAAFLAPEGRRLDGRGAARRAGDVVPAHRRGDRAGGGRDLRSRRAQPGGSAHRERGAPAGREELWEEAFELGLATRT